MPSRDLPARPPQALRDPDRGWVHLVTYGCQMNVLDSELMAGELLRAGYGLTDREEDATVLLFNTCSVRQLAEEKVRGVLGTLRQRKERQPDLVIGVVGCMAQREGQALLDRFQALDLVCGTRSHGRLGELLEQASAGQRVLDVDEGDGPQFQRDVTRRPGPQQALVAVMRGCSRACSYCIVPRVRGPERSRRVEEIVEEVARLAADGVREVTLLGQNIDSYRDPGGARLPQVLEGVHELAGLHRIRFLTSHPADLQEELLETMARLPRVAPFLHLPAQSGSNRILAAMRRGYTRERYLTLVAKARRLIQDLEVASDFIVGFPGETEEDYQRTEELVREVGFQTSYIFKYSPRPGTRAAALEDDVPLAEKKRRNQLLLAAQEATARRRNQALHGQVLEVLLEGPSRTDPSQLSGRSGGNHIVIFPPPAGLPRPGEPVQVRITDSTPLSLRGEALAGGGTW